MICKERQDLIEKLGVHMEMKSNLAPVAARILAYMFLKGKSGTTFDELVNDLSASKSTVSTHLSHLSDLNKVQYFTKPGDRKKYYVINKNGIIQSFNEMISTWNSELELHQEIMDYKDMMNDKSDVEVHYDLDFHKDYIQFLQEAIKAISTIKTKIINKNL